MRSDPDTDQDLRVLKADQDKAKGCGSASMKAILNDLGGQKTAS
jgi:hypothetical protein